VQRFAVSVNVNFQRRSVNGSIRPFFCVLSDSLLSGMMIPKKVRIPSSAVCDGHIMPLLRYEHIFLVNQRSRSVHQPEATTDNSQSDHGQTDSG